MHPTRTRNPATQGCRHQDVSGLLIGRARKSPREPLGHQVPPRLSRCIRRATSTSVLFVATASARYPRNSCLVPLVVVDVQHRWDGRA